MEKRNTIKQIGMDEAKKLLTIYMKCKLPTFLWGSPGIGKSSLIHQIGEQTKRKVIDIRLSQIEFSDLRGIPFIKDEEKEKKVVWSIPSFLPLDKDDNSIIFFDELNLAHPSIMNAAYQLILDRKIGDYKLPEGVSIVAAGNRSEDSVNVNEIPFPLLNRFTHISIKCDFSTWLTYAKDKFHPYVVEFLETNKRHLTTENYATLSEAFNTPRTWEYVSKILYSIDVNNTPNKIRCDLIMGCVGETLSVIFERWIKDREKDKRLSIGLVFKDPDYSIRNFKMKIEDVSLLEKYLEENAPPSSQIDNSFSFLEKHSDVEVIIRYSKFCTSKGLTIVSSIYPKAYHILENLIKNNPDLVNGYDEQ